MGNIDEELLYAIRAMEVLLESGTGVGEAIKHIADEEYGELSKVFQTILDNSQNTTLADAIRLEMTRTKSEGLRKVLSTLAMTDEGDADAIDRLRSIAKKESRERRIELETYIDFLGSTSEQFLIISILIPIVVVIGAVINGLVESAKDTGGPIGQTPTMPDVCVPAMFIIASIIIAAMVLMTKKKEPKV